MEKKKKIAVTAVFLVVILGLAAAHLLLPDQMISSAERRKLEQIPQITAKDVFKGDYFQDLEKYLLDQFPMRQQFRTVKALFQCDVLGMKDTNGLYYADGHLMKLENTFKEGQANLALGKINAMIESHPEAHKVYYSVIPDKNYFLAEKNGYPVMDYTAAMQHISKIHGQYIDIFPTLTVDDYYRTDSHWRQESILPAAQALAQAMGTVIDGEDAYTSQMRDDFRGVYYGQAALPVGSETLTVMNSAVTEDAVVHSAEHKDVTSVYCWNEFDKVDPYDVYLSGAEALITLENPHAAEDRHLILFRDSFGSSIAPLLLSGYSKVTLVDLRYIASPMVHEQVDFTDADVLFLYNVSMFNAGGTFK